jgi:hypothetical protein
MGAGEWGYVSTVTMARSRPPIAAILAAGLSGTAVAQHVSGAELGVLPGNWG